MTNETINDVLEFMVGNENRKPKHKEYKIDKSLTKIILPKEKIKMFIEWFNTDIRHQNYIPQAFNEGYLTVQNDFVEFLEEQHKEEIKDIAKEFNTTYNQVKNSLLELAELTKEILIYFKFIDDTIDFFGYINKKEFFIVILI